MAAPARRRHSSTNPWQDELEGHRQALAHGQLLAVPAAMLLCAVERIDPPEWLTKAAAALFVKMLTNKLPKGRGRTANWLTRHRQANIDSARHALVLETRDARERLDREIEELERSRSPQARRVARMKSRFRKRLGNKNTHAFKWGSDELKKTHARGTARAIKDSFYKIERARKRGVPENRSLYEQFEILTKTYVNTSSTVKRII